MSSNFTIVVHNLVELDEMNEDDANVIGVYSIDVENADRYPESEICTAILNRFHDSYGIENLDDLDILVFNPEGKQISEDFESDSEYDIDVGDPEAISSDPNDFYLDRDDG